MNRMLPLADAASTGITYRRLTEIPDGVGGSSWVPIHEALAFRLRAYGNAIVPQVAAAFIRAYRDVREVA